MRVAGRAAAAAVLLVPLCACRSRGPIPFGALPAPPCPAAGAIEWVGPIDRDDRARLSAWCRSVGPVVVVDRGADRPPVDLARRGLVVVTWNVHEGAGDVERLVSEIRRPAAGGSAEAPEVVLLVQEAVRAGAGVPAAFSASVSAPRRVAPRGGHDDIGGVAARLGMSIAYVPSMRNGGGREGREDRGNAIVSTLPLSQAIGIELPWVHQRRVAVMAAIGGLVDGAPWRARLVSVHLDTRPGRSAQAAALAGWLTAFARDDEPIVVGGDLNTWFGRREQSVVRLARAVPRVGECGDAPTFGFRRHLDYLFTSLPFEVRRGCAIARDFYGSDHRPTILRLFR